MDLLTEFLIYFLCFMVALYFIAYYQKVWSVPKNFPPGPHGHPILGGLPELGTKLPLGLMKVGEKWGSIFACDLAGYRVVILNDHKAIKDALSIQGLEGKVPSKVFQYMTAGQTNMNQGVMFSFGKVHSNQRRFSLKNLRDFGFGRKSMEAFFEVEIRDLLEAFKKEEGKPIIINTHFNGAVMNSLWGILTGERYPQDDSRMRRLYHNITSDIQMIFVLFFFPVLFKVAKWFPFFIGSKIASYQNNMKESLKFMQDRVDDHKKNFQEGISNDYIDRYLMEIKKEKDPNSDFYGKNGENNLVTSLHDYFIAGSETTSTALSFGMHALAIHQDIQEKFHQEIKSVCGYSRLVTLADRPMIPYAEAFMMELLRFASIVPFHLHYAVEDCELRGYKIPKGTVIGLNIYGAHHNKEVWGDPEHFRPERFLSPTGEVIRNNEAFMPFSVGKRFCLGEPLARDELFLFLASMVQRYHIKPDSKLRTTPKLIGELQQVNTPKTFPIVITDRYEE